MQLPFIRFAEDIQAGAMPARLRVFIDWLEEALVRRRRFGAALTIVS